MEQRTPVPHSGNEAQFSRVAALLGTPNGCVFAAMKGPRRDLGHRHRRDALAVGESPFPIVKVFNGQGGLLHDAFTTPDGRHHVLASQTIHHMAISDAVNLTEVGLIDTGPRPHPGPGAVWGDFTPSIGEGKLDIINTTSWETQFTAAVGGPALFTRTCEFGAPVNHNVTWERDPANLTCPSVLVGHRPVHRHGPEQGAPRAQPADPV